jgi:hypothetical protein
MVEVGNRVVWSGALKSLYPDMPDASGQVVCKNGDWITVEVAVADRHISPFVIKRDWEVSVIE